MLLSIPKFGRIQIGSFHFLMKYILAWGSDTGSYDLGFFSLFTF